MREIKTFEELSEIESKKFDEACRLDLLFVLKGIRVIDGYVLIIGADCKNSIELFYMSIENFDLLNEKEKYYIRMEYKI